jgi:hypothetical protein
MNRTSWLSGSGLNCRPLFFRPRRFECLFSFCRAAAIHRPHLHGCRRITMERAIRLRCRPRIVMLNMKLLYPLYPCRNNKSTETLPCLSFLQSCTACKSDDTDELFSEIFCMMKTYARESRSRKSKGIGKDDAKPRPMV